MKISGHIISPMYLWAIILLTAVAAVSSYTLHIVPYSLILAVVIAVILDFAIGRFYLKHRFRIPLTAIITGLIIGSVAPTNASIPFVVLAVFVAILSKHLIKFKHSNIFNPAVLGLVAGLLVLGVGTEWWAAATYNFYAVTISLTPILILLAYLSKRFTSALSYLAAILVITVVTTDLLGSLSVGPLISTIFGLPFFFAFAMLTDPKTSPHKRYPQILYGVGVAILSTAIALFRVNSPMLFALLIANLFYLGYRYSLK